MMLLIHSMYEVIMFKDLEKTFSKRVEEKVLQSGEGYIESIKNLCDEMEIEPELAAKYLSQPIIEKIKAEAEDIYLMPKTPKLFSNGG